MRSSTSDRVFDWVVGTMFITFVIAFIVLLVTSAYDKGYEDGYCSALNGSTIGDARVCNVDGMVVEIPSP